jgi:metal-dependent HD superfamily phosphatase/phosphodiesterase
MIKTVNDVLTDKEITTYLSYADHIFETVGYKEHGIRHAKHASDRAGYVLKELGYSETKQNLAKIAGYLHDIGNMVSRKGHAQSGAVMALNLLKPDKKNIEYSSDIFEVFGAIGSHEDKSMQPPTDIAAAVILGDKTDVHCERLRTEDQYLRDAHSKVVGACENSEIQILKEKKEITLQLAIDTKICSIMEYFEIFTPRMNYCTKASNKLGCEFNFYINGDKFI